MFFALSFSISVSASRRLPCLSLSFNAAIVLCIRGIERITSASVFVGLLCKVKGDTFSISVPTPVEVRSVEQSLPSFINRFLQGRTEP